MALRLSSSSSPISHILRPLLPSNPAIQPAFVPRVRLGALLRQPSRSSPNVSIGFRWSIPGLFSDIWESILRAVPKKKTSHRKKRQRLLAGKALKDVQGLNKCPACGRVKKSHLLCPHCVRDIKKMWKEMAELEAEE